VVYGISTVIGAIAFWGIWNLFNPPPPPSPPSPPARSYPPDGVLPTQVQLPNVSPGGGAGGGGAGGGGGGGGGAIVQGPPLRASCNLPPAGASLTSYENDRILLDIPANVPVPVLDQIAARHGMTRLETSFIRLIGRTLHVWRIDNGTPVAKMGRNVCTTEPLVAGLQPSYIFRLTQDQQEPSTAPNMRRRNSSCPRRIASRAATKFSSR